MSLFRLLICVLVLSLTACGFEPMYKAGGSRNSQHASNATIYIENIPNRHGQFLRNALIDRLYTKSRPSDALWRLKISTPTEKELSLGIKKDASSTITQKTISIKMELVQNVDDSVILSRTFKTSVSYNVLDNQFATLVSERNITENILQELADDVMNELNLYFYSKQYP